MSKEIQNPSPKFENYRERYYLKSQEAYNKLLGKAASLVDINKRLEEWPFIGQWSAYVATNYYSFATMEFAFILRNIADVYSDGEIYLLMPGPEDHDTWPFGISALCWQNDWVPEEYLKALVCPTKGGGWLSMFHTTSVIFGDSGNWVAIPDYDWDITVFAFKDSQFKETSIAQNPIWFPLPDIESLVIDSSYDYGVYKERRDKLLGFLRSHLDE